MGLFNKKKLNPLGGLERIGLDLADDLGMKKPGAGMSDPVHGSMHVVGCSALDAREMRAPCHVTYVIQADGIEAFSGEQVFELWAAQWPQPGDDLPVIFDRANPSHVDVDTTQVPNSADQAMTDAQQLAAQLNAGGGAAGASGTAPGGTISALEQLAALHDRGALTDDEFAAQKQKLLAS
jgi:hypothetical protein